MLQIFLKTSAITPQDWAKAYEQIAALTTGFPLKLLRIEAYSGYEKDLDKEHFDLVEAAGTPAECLSFFGDWASFTHGFTVRFYKDWDKQRKQGMNGEEHDVTRPVTWAPPKKFRNDGSLPEANGSAIGQFGYLSTEGGSYEYALLAIGILLENLLPGRAFLIAHDHGGETLQALTEWLAGYFRQRFDPPLHADKQRLLDSFEQAYPEKKDAVGRMDQLYPKKFKQNMAFALEHIGHEPAFKYYAEALTDATFGTFGFADILDPWIAASQDLESTLRLVAESKRLLLLGDAGDRENAAKYDLAYLLKKLLQNYVLWTPQQRELLQFFHTNRQALETGSEDLWGSILRMSGYRVDICPFHANPEELFKAFMYHDPKNGAVFKRIIEGWQDKNADAYEQLQKKLEALEHLPDPAASSDGPEEGDEEKDLKNKAELAVFLQKYPPHEHFLMEKAVRANPAFMHPDDALEDLLTLIKKLNAEPENQSYQKKIAALPLPEKRLYIRQLLKQKRMSIHPDFEQWLEAEQNDPVLTHLLLLLPLKIHDRSRAFARHLILFDRELWKRFR